MSLEYEQACREVDELTPGSPPLFRPPNQAPPLVLPRGWRYDERDHVYVDPKGGRIEAEFILSAPCGAQEWFVRQAASLGDVLEMAAKVLPPPPDGKR